MGTGSDQEVAADLRVVQRVYRLFFVAATWRLIRLALTLHFYEVDERLVEVKDERELPRFLLLSRQVRRLNSYPLLGSSYRLAVPFLIRTAAIDDVTRLVDLVDLASPDTGVALLAVSYTHLTLPTILRV